jgi:hypothetical protein
LSYDLRVLRDDGGDLDLDRARAALPGAEQAGDELYWERDALTAAFLLTPAEIGVGVSADDAPRADRARDFEQLLGAVLDLAEQLGARVHDPQLGRELGREDVPAAVAFFA